MVVKGEIEIYGTIIINIWYGAWYGICSAEF